MTMLSTAEQAASSDTMPHQCHMLCSEQPNDKNTLSAYRFRQKALCILNVKSMVAEQISEVRACSGRV